jgi:hypothetical protein
MRLLNTNTLKFEDVWNETNTRYAILSHTWDEEEVSYQDMQDISKASQKLGFLKIQKTCGLALAAGLAYAWIDTCCINKDSSAELSEAINSMFRWYQNCTVCFATLSDVQLDPDAEDEVELRVESSRWFTRGWTLQELIAPHYMVFFDKSWNAFGDKQDITAPHHNVFFEKSWRPFDDKRSLLNLVARKTGIPREVLSGYTHWSEYSIAQRMSWAAKRQTTRTEDIAYCLLGIFDVNMPLLYGEGKRAFIRLQEEIARTSDDQTIFAWHLDESLKSGLFASHPAAFAHGGSVVQVQSRRDRSPYATTNRGVSISLLLTPVAVDLYLAQLSCFDRAVMPQAVSRIPDSNRATAKAPATESAELYRVGIFLRRLSEDDQYCRVMHRGASLHQTLDESHSGNSSNLYQLSNCSSKVILVSVRQPSSYAPPNFHLEAVNGFQISTALIALARRPDGPCNICGSGDIGDHKCILLTNEPWFGHGASIELAHRHLWIQRLTIGFDFDHNPICIVDLRLPPDMEYFADGPYHRIAQGSWKSLTHHVYDAADMTARPYLDHPQARVWARDVKALKVLGDRIDGLRIDLRGCASIVISRQPRSRTTWLVDMSLVAETAGDDNDRLVTLRRVETHRDKVRLHVSVKEANLNR